MRIPSCRSIIIFIANSISEHVRTVVVLSRTGVIYFKWKCIKIKFTRKQNLHYHLAENLLSYADSERDLGVHVNKSFNFNEHCVKLLTKSNAPVIF